MRATHSRTSRLMSKVCHRMRLYILTDRKRRYPSSLFQTTYVLSDVLARPTALLYGLTRACSSRRPSLSPPIISLQATHCASKISAPLQQALQDSRRSSRRPQGRQALGQAEDGCLMPPERRRLGRHQGLRQGALWRPLRGTRTRTGMQAMEELAPRSEIGREYHELLPHSRGVSRFRE